MFLPLSGFGPKSGTTLFISLRTSPPRVIDIARLLLDNFEVQTTTKNHHDKAKQNHSSKNSRGSRIKEKERKKEKKTSSVIYGPF